MRTTFTLDDDLVPKLKLLMRRKKQPLRKVINDLLKAAIHLEAKDTAPLFIVKSCNLGLKAGYDPTKFNSLYDELETEALRRERRK